MGKEHQISKGTTPPVQSTEAPEQKSSTLPLLYFIGVSIVMALVAIYKMFFDN